MNPAVTSTLKNAGNSIVGIVPKALLIIHSDPPGGSPVGGALSSKTAGALSTASKGASALSSIAGVPAGAKVLQVQYNPNSISLQANASSTPFQYLQQNVDSSIPTQTVRNPSVVLTAELIFDAMNPKDAFMFDKLRLSVGDAVSAVSGLVQAGKGGYTVKPQTNGILAALFKDSTRLVTFKWADMTFTGELTEANATYTMFSVSGKPVRSTVRLNITQQVDKQADVTYWDSAFTKTFGSAAAGAVTGGRSFANKCGNLLNIGF